MGSPLQELPFFLWTFFLAFSFFFFHHYSYTISTTTLIYTLILNLKAMFWCRVCNVSCIINEVIEVSAVIISKAFFIPIQSYVQL